MMGCREPQFSSSGFLPRKDEKWTINRSTIDVS
jgi:hypothetical protein